MKTFQELKDKINNGGYTTKLSYPRRTENMKDGYITDENQSVKWNKEQVQINKEKYQQALADFHKDSTQKEIDFQKDLINLITTNFDLSEGGAKVIYNKAWDEDHSDGLISVVDTAFDLANFVNDVIINNID